MKLQVVKFNDGSLVLNSTKNPELAHIQVAHASMSINDQGFFEQRTIKALVRNLPKSMLTNVVEGQDLTAIVPGKYKIVSVDSLTPQYDGQQPRKTKEGEVIPSADGQLVYNQKIVVSESSNLTDVKIAAPRRGAVATSTLITAEAGELA